MRTISIKQVMVVTALTLAGLSICNSDCNNDIRTLVHILVCAVASYTAFKSYKLQKVGLSWLFGTIAVVYFIPFLCCLFAQSSWFYIHALISSVLMIGAFCFSDSSETCFRAIINDLDEIAKLTKFPYVRHVVILSVIGFLYVLINGPDWVQKVFAVQSEKRMRDEHAHSIDSKSTNGKDQGKKTYDQMLEEFVKSAKE